MARSPDRDAGHAPAERVIVHIDGLEELTAIREALDEIRGDIAWWINNHRGDQWLPVQPVSTLPTDADVSPRNGQCTDDSLPTTQRHARTPPPQQPSTTSSATPNEDLDDDIHFCCQAPDLQWTGDPHFPGVACMHCGYIVADCGSVVMQASLESDPDPEPKEQQRDLFTNE